MQVLALNPGFFNRLVSDWALYPDHVVFLGAEAQIYSDWSEFNEKKQFMDQQPELLFVQDSGVYILPSFNKTKQDQLRCYYDILCLLPPDTKLQVLNDEDISELLNWDAEQYRMSLAKHI
jgi:rhamnose utilization protein RhaD (predicted bifunctional aldolase and dehydrogenase)